MMREQRPKKTPTETAITQRLQKLELRRTYLSMLGKLLAVLLVLWSLFSFVYGLSVVKDNGMSPAFHEGDLVLYYRLQKDYASGDAVACSIDGQQLFGRIAAVAGDEVLITEDGQLVINGYVQTDENATLTYPVENGCQYPVTVGENEFFILGDRRGETVDSRIFGAVPADSLDGKVITLLRRRSI